LKASSQLVRDDGGGSDGPAGGALRCESHERLADLLAGVAAGDRAALASLYEETSPVIFGLLRHVLGAGAEAEETLVEVYSCVWRRAATYRPGKASALAWLVSSALECAKGRGRPGAAEEADAAGPLRTDGGAGEAAGKLPAYIDAEAARAREAFGRLDPKQRDALQLSYFYGPARTEAALGLSAVEARALVGNGLRSYAEMFRAARPNQRKG
jgi:RNA polymerase sigma-70 factor, ECF subfamily